VCDWAYLLLAEQVRALTAADRTALLTAVAVAGGELDMDALPDPEAAVRRLDDLLAADVDELAGLDPEAADLLIGLGLRR
jgi:hypothetical protein